MSPTPGTRHDRMRVSQACENCRDKKSKCNGAKPVCGRCQLKALDCHYGVTKRVKNQQVMRELATKVAQYERMLQKTISAPQSLYQATQQSDETGAASSLSTSAASALVQSEPASVISGLASIDPSTTQADVLSSPSMSYCASELSTRPDSDPNETVEHWGRSLLENISLPPRGLLDRAIDAFLQGSAFLFTFFDDHDLSGLMEDVYNNAHPSKAALTQLCAVGAVGCQYYPQRFDVSTPVALLSIVKLGLEECIEQTPLLAMRTTALLAMYYTFDKKTAALLYVDTGLRLARMNRDSTGFQGYPSTPWQRIFGSLVFLDCWLCANTGHLPNLQHSELHTSLILMSPGNASINAVVQTEMVKIAILTGSILRDVYHARFVSSTTIANYKSRLQEWLLTLPEYMRLDYLLGQEGNTSYLRPVFVVHLLYMNTIILLYRRALVELASFGHRWRDPELFEQTRTFLEPCLWTGRQVAKMLEIVLSQGVVLQKCWIFINSTYSTCTVLLYFVANRLLAGDRLEEVRPDLAAVQSCIEVLKFCGEYDNAASMYLANTLKVYTVLSELLQTAIAASKSEHDDDDDDETVERLKQVVSQIAGFLVHPFDGGYRRDVKAFADGPTTLSDTEHPSSISERQADGDVPSPDAQRQARGSSLPFFLHDVMYSRSFRGNAESEDNFMHKKAGESFSLTSTGGVVFGS